MRHPDRWMLVYVIALVGGTLSVGLAFGEHAADWALVVASVLMTLGSLFYKAHQQGFRPSLSTLFGAAVGIGWIAWGTFVLRPGGASWWLTILAVGPPAAVALGWANVRWRWDREDGQHRREVAAEATARPVIAGDRPVGPFALYLRPFASTDRLPAQPLWGVTEAPSHLDVETVLDRALRDQCPMQALGRGGDIAEGAARIVTSDDTWQSNMAAQADRATFIIMLPLARPSTSWELQWLTEHDLLGKVLMVMPETPWPVSPGFTSSVERNDRIFPAWIERDDTERHRLDLYSEWRRAIQTAREIGVDLPPYANVGALFTIDAAAGQVARIVPLSLSTMASSRRVDYVRTAITTFGLLNAKPNPRSDPLPALERAFRYRGNLELTLIRAADGFTLWGDTCTAATLLSRAAAKRRRRPGWAYDYLKELPGLAQCRSQKGDHEAAARYKASIPVFLKYPELAALMRRN